MIEQGLFKRHVVGRDGFQWWIGQVAPEESWKENIPGVPVETNEDESYKGFGERVRVRIMGYATESAEIIPDEELPWAHVMYPVTAGGGGRGSWQSMNLVGGNFVFGFFLDGEDAQQPVIMGVIGYNDYQEVMKTIEGPTRYIPHSGFDQEQENNTVPPYSVPQSGSGQTASQEYATGTPNNDLINESTQGSNSIKEMSAKEMQRKGQATEPLAKTEDCEPTPTNRIQVEMQNIIREMEHLQNSINDVRSAISIGEADIEGQIAGLQKKLTRFMSANMKSILEQVEKTIIEKVNTTVKPIHNVLMPNERPELKEKMELANELIACLFTKMFGQLFGMLDDMLSDLFGNNSGSGKNNTGAKKAVNIPICFVNDIVGTAIGTVMNELNQEIDGVMSSLDDLLKSTAEAAEAAGGLIGSLGSIGSMGGFDLSQLLEDAFSFFKCEEKIKCPTQDTWSMWYGMETGQSSSKKSQKAISKSSKKYSSKNKEVNNGFKGIKFNDLYEDGACGDQIENLGPRECGPPTAKLTGGFGAEANLIITQTGKVIAADVTKLGVNYSKYEANVQVYDDCGLGTGAIVEPITDKVEVRDRGDGFLVITYGDRQSLIPGGQMDGGNLGYIDDPEEPMIPVLDENGDPFPSRGESVSIVDAIVIAPGTDYLPAPDGSLGGDGRQWADPDDTIIIVPTPGGGVGWLPPVPPGVVTPVNPGEVVVTPPTSPVVVPVPLLPVEPLPVVDPPVVDPPVVDPGPVSPDPFPDRPLFPDVDPPVPIGGGDPPEPQPIPPGVPTPITTPGTITTPEPDSSRPTYQYPVASDESYPVILYLCDIIIQDPGFNYTSKDELVITPNNGASATVKLDDIGRVVSVTVDNGGGSFTEIPRIHIRSQTGYNAKLTPKFCIDRLEGEVKDPAINEKLVTVIDCTTRPPNGYLDGKPYYGPFHEHNGVKMVGSEHTSISHATLTDRP